MRKSASDFAINREKHRTVFLADKVEVDDERPEEEDLTDIEIDDNVNDNSGDKKVDDVVDARRDHEFVKLAESQDLEEILEIFNQIFTSSDIPTKNRFSNISRRKYLKAAKSSKMCLLRFSYP